AGFLVRDVLANPFRAAEHALDAEDLPRRVRQREDERLEVRVSPALLAPPCRGGPKALPQLLLRVGQPRARRRGRMGSVRSMGSRSSSLDDRVRTSHAPHTSPTARTTPTCGPPPGQHFIEERPDNGEALDLV